MTSYFHLVLLTINLGNKNVKIGIFTGATNVRLNNIFTDISRYPTGKHEINDDLRHPPTSCPVSVIYLMQTTIFARVLTLSQTTNIRLFETETVFKRQFQF